MTKLTNKGPKQKRDHYQRTLHIPNSLGIKFQRKLNILNLRTKLTQKGYFQSKKEQNENHHRILHIRNSLGVKFQLQQIILTFWTKFAPKKNTSGQKQKK